MDKGLNYAENNVAVKTWGQRVLTI